MAVVQLGGHPVTIRPDEIGLGEREAISDVARVLSRYFAVLGARTFAHRTLTELASHSLVPVINLLSDDGHPIQILADLLTLQHEFGDIAPLEIAWVGDANNVARSLIEGSALAGVADATSRTGGPLCMGRWRHAQLGLGRGGRGGERGGQRRRQIAVADRREHAVLRPAAQVHLRHELLELAGLDRVAKVGFAVGRRRDHRRGPAAAPALERVEERDRVGRQHVRRAGLGARIVQDPDHPVVVGARAVVFVGQHHHREQRVVAQEAGVGAIGDGYSAGRAGSSQPQPVAIGDRFFGEQRDAADL